MLTEDEFRKCINYINIDTHFLTEMQIQMLYTLYIASHVDFDSVRKEIQEKEEE